MSSVTQTIPTASVVFMAISGLIAIALPVVLFFVFRGRYRARFLPVIVGAVSFVLFAMILEPILHGVLFANSTIGGFLTSRWWIYGLYGGLAAGLFEETGRLCSFYVILRGNNKYNSLGGALAYGVGHGGMEAILLCAATMIANILFVIALRTGNSAMASMLVSGQDVTTAVAALGAMPPSTFLASGIERIIAVAFHVAASVLVWMSATGRGPWGLFFLSIAFHTLINFPAGAYTYGLITNVWVYELITAVLVTVVCLVVAHLYKRCSQFYTPLLQYEPGDFSL